MAKLYFLPGDSYPKDAHVERALRRRLEPLRFGWAGPYRTPELRNPADPHPNPTVNVQARVQVVGALITAAADPLPPVLIARSSGCRVATVLAGRQPVSATVCLGYPFHFPGRAVEPERFEHLTTLATPTLILQGRNDSYGGRGVADRYPLSDAVRLQFIDANHSQMLSPEAWDDVAAVIADFIWRHLPGASVRARAA